MSTAGREKDIALVHKDIQYIKQDMAEIKAALKLVLSHYITREDVEGKIAGLQNEIDERFKGIHARVDTKVSKEDFIRIERSITDAQSSNSVKWGAIAQSVISTVLTTAIMGALAYAFLTK